MLRTSSYTIYIDLPDRSDEMLLVQTYTGAFDQVSRSVADYVRSLELGKPPKPLYGEWSTGQNGSNGNHDKVESPSDETIKLLSKRGYLTNMTKDEEYGFFKRFADKMHEAYTKRWPSYLFMPTYDCNLRCSYCFQDHMRTDKNFQHLLRRVKPEMVDRIFAAMPQIEALHGLPPNAEVNGSIGFFGGEPLLAANRPIVEYIIKKGRARGPFNYWAITNGTDLDAYEDLLSPDGISRVQITIDGPPTEHDKRRIYADGSGSWENIKRNVDMALERGISVIARTNVDRNNVGDLVELAEEFIRNGWPDYPNFTSGVAAIRASNDQTEQETTMNTWELEKCVSEMQDQNPDMRVIGRTDDSIRGQAQRIFTSQGLPSFKPVFCSAHTGMYMFDAFGDIYACWEKTGDKKVRIGYIGEEAKLVLNHAVNDMWMGRNVASNPVCQQCRYNLFCGGGCAVLAHDHSGGYYRNYCDGFSNRFRKAVSDAYADFEAGRLTTSSTGSLCDV